MRNFVQMVIVLVVVGIVSGLVLAGVYRYAQPKIQMQQEEERQRAIYSILKGAEEIKTIRYKDREIYQGLDLEGKIIGYAFEAKGTGYQGEIILMVGLSSDLTKILGIEVLESKETPGLGSRIEEEDFKARFRDLSTSDIGKVDAITGATISSKSVIKIVEEEVAKIKEILKKVKQ
jgi:electron transport complex protein RnfG